MTLIYYDIILNKILYLFHSDDNIEQFQNQGPQRLHTVYTPQQNTKTLPHIPDPSETATIQNASEISGKTTNNPQSLTVTIDSNIVQIPVHDITQNTLPHQNQYNTDININQDNTSTVSTSDTNITPQFQTQQPSPRNYDPPPIPPQYSTQTTSHNPPQQGSSNTPVTNLPQIQPTVPFQTTTPTRSPLLPTLAYTPAQHTNKKFTTRFNYKYSSIQCNTQIYYL